MAPDPNRHRSASPAGDPGMSLPRARMLKSKPSVRAVESLLHSRPEVSVVVTNSSSLTRPRVLALFSGAGGLDLGFSLAGFDVQVSSDVEPVFLESIDANVGRYFPKDHKSVCADVSQVAPEQLGPGPYDFMIGGPPCQSFSAAGRRAGGVHGVNDFRGSLFWHYCRLIEHFQPKGFLFENVRGLLQANGGRDWQVILSAFESLGYAITYRVLDAAAYGVPQHRERLIVVGLKDHEFLFPRPTHGPDSKSQRPYVSTGEALADIDDPDEIVPPYGGKWGDLLMEIPPGMNYLHFTEEMGHPEPRFAWRSRFSDFLYKMDPALPSKTIVASQGRYGGPFHWRSRKLTLAEYKRLQSFPDDYAFAGSYLVAVKQIGNSVAPLFAEALARAVMVEVFDPAYADVELLSPDQQLSFDSRKRIKAKRTMNRRSATDRASALQLTLGDSAAVAMTPEIHKAEWHYNMPRAKTAHPSKTSRSFKVDAVLENGEWRVAVKELARRRLPARYELNLAFRPNGNRTFSAIGVRLDCSSLDYAAVAWDAVDWCVTLSSSYSSIQPLYGHFTEPHPKFELHAAVNSDEEPGLCEFIRRSSNFEYVSATRPISEIVALFPETNASESVRHLRELGWDVRTHETNRAIPAGYFRSCYPFTVSLNEPRFVVWREKGSHRTADRSAIPDD